MAATGQTSVTGNVFVAKTPEPFTYDSDGNLTCDGRWTNRWDAENRLIGMEALSSVPTGGKKALGFTYDARNRRQSLVVSNWSGSAWTNVTSQTRRFVYDGWNLLAALDGNNSLVQSFVWGLDLSAAMQGAGGVGGLLAVNDAANGVHFAAYDGNGNVAALVKGSDGTATANYEYGPFGEVLRATGLMAKANPFRFSTKYQDDDSDLLYFGYRFYNSAIGRWLSRDPVRERGGLNLHGFVRNAPVSGFDALGLAYTITDLTPSGLWMLSVKNVTVPTWGEIKGFHSRYLPSNGRHDQPLCPCKIENIVLVQAVYDAVKHPTQFDTDAGPGKLPPHNADDPIPGYTSPGNLTIIDAPHLPTNPDWSGTWRFEDCAVCRTTARDGSISDQVLGCIKFVLHRDDRNEVQLSVQVGGTTKKGKSVYIELAEAPGKMWKEALADWRKRGK